MTDLITALVTALTTVKTDFMSALGQILPVALAITSAVIVITLGIKVFKRIAGRG